MSDSDSDDRDIITPDSICLCFTQLNRNRTTCSDCNHHEVDHLVCSFFLRHMNIASRCRHCGRKEIDHFPCKRYTEFTVSAEQLYLDDDGRCSLCGLYEEDHAYNCDKFRAFDDDPEICEKCEMAATSHLICEFYEAPDKQGINHSSNFDCYCVNCGQLPEKHTLCDRFAANSSGIWCLDCGLHQDVHRACARFEAKDGLCKTCGKGETQHVWDNFLKNNLKSSINYEHNSSFPVRCGSSCSFFVDGKDSFEAIAEALECAKYEILIADWILSPEVYLRRNENSGICDRLDHILLERAVNGVQIYILAWNETKLAFKFANGHAKATLEGLHENIKVVTHPETTPIEWSHHDKFIVIDRLLAFTGGLDLAFGRYDTSEHMLVDDCHLQLTWPGKDYYNPTIAEMCQVNEPFNDLVDRTIQPRMPWHDVYCCLWGSDIPKDFFLHFAQRWNHHIRDLGIDHTYAMILPDMMLSNKKEGSNVGIVNTNSDVASSILQKVCSLKTVSPKVNYPMRRSTSGNALADASEKVRPRAYRQHSKDLEFNDVVENVALKSFLSTLAYNSSGCDAQVLRSIGLWSGGQDDECSILFAMLDAIKNSKHYIYIENQYFVSTTMQNDDDGDCPENEIALAIVERIGKAIRENSEFHIYVVLPITPEGNFREDAIQRYIMSLQYNTIHRRDYSIFQTLKAEFPNIDISKYISFFSLRKCNVLGKKLVTEMIYVHSKLFMVDDKISILGSPNINDRSLLGDRDSEVAVIIEDQEFVGKKMNGQPYASGLFSYRLRCRLWMEHLGLDDDLMIIDPLHYSTRKLWDETARTNTEIYESLFPDINSNRIQSMSDLKAAMEKAGRNSQAYVCNCECNADSLEKLNKTKGHLVWYPYNFLTEFTDTALVQVVLSNFKSGKIFQ